MNFDHIEARLANPDPRLPENEYEHVVHLTSKLLGRKYMVVHKMCEKAGWGTAEIRRRYELATKHCGDMPSDVYWWWLRKKDLSTGG